MRAIDAQIKRLSIVGQKKEVIVRQITLVDIVSWILPSKSFRILWILSVKKPLFSTYLA